MADGSVAYLFRFVSDGVQAVATLNGYPIARSGGRPRHAESRKVNDLLVEGANRFVVDVSRTDVHPRQLVETALDRGVHASAPQEVAPMFEHQFKGDEHAPPDGTPHEVLRHDVRLDRAFGRWAWQDARPFRREDARDVVALHQAVVGAFDRRDVDALMALFSVKYEELARSVEVPAADFARGAADRWRRILARPQVVVEAAPANAIETASWSDGRLVDVAARGDRAPVIVHGATDRLQLSVPYVISVIEGRVVIVR